MIAALGQTAWPIRHDVVIPVLVVLGLWAAAAWYYADHTFRGGAIATPEQAIAAAQSAPCVAQASEADRTGGWHAELLGSWWVVHKEFYEVPVLKLGRLGHLSATYDAVTGKMVECRTGVSN